MLSIFPPVPRYRLSWLVANHTAPSTDQEYNMTNPEGIRFDLGHDFVQTLLQKGTSPPPAVPDRVLLALLVSLALWSLVFGDSAEL